MSFQNKLKKGAPFTYWNNVSTPLTREFSKIHTHKDGSKGGDVYYKDSTGKVQASMHGLTVSEAQYLKKIRGF